MLIVRGAAWARVTTSTAIYSACACREKLPGMLGANTEVVYNSRVYCVNRVVGLSSRSF